MFIKITFIILWSAGKQNSLLSLCESRKYIPTGRTVRLCQRGTWHFYGMNPDFCSKGEIGGTRCRRVHLDNVSDSQGDSQLPLFLLRHENPAAPGRYCHDAEKKGSVLSLPVLWLWADAQSWFLKSIYLHMICCQFSEWSARYAAVWLINAGYTSWGLLKSGYTASKYPGAGKRFCVYVLVYWFFCTGIWEQVWSGWLLSGFVDQGLWPTCNNSLFWLHSCSLRKWGILWKNPENQKFLLELFLCSPIMKMISLLVSEKICLLVKLSVLL